MSIISNLNSGVLGWWRGPPSTGSRSFIIFLHALAGQLLWRHTHVLEGLLDLILSEYSGQVLAHFLMKTSGLSRPWHVSFGRPQLPAICFNGLTDACVCASANSRLESQPVFILTLCNCRGMKLGVLCVCMWNYMHACHFLLIKEKQDLSVVFPHRQAGQKHEGGRLTRDDCGHSFQALQSTNSYQWRQLAGFYWGKREALREHRNVHCFGKVISG